MCQRAFVKVRIGGVEGGVEVNMGCLWMGIDTDERVELEVRSEGSDY